MTTTWWLANRWDDASRADLARRWIAGEMQRDIGESLNTTAATVCHQIANFCNTWARVEVRGRLYQDNRRAVALVALRNYFLSCGEPPPMQPVWRRYDRANINDEDYYEARREHMWLLRAEGATYKSIGRRCDDITGTRVKQIIDQFGRRTRRAMRRTRFRWEENAPPEQTPQPGGALGSKRSSALYER